MVQVHVPQGVGVRVPPWAPQIPQKSLHQAERNQDRVQFRWGLFSLVVAIVDEMNFFHKKSVSLLTASRPSLMILASVAEHAAECK
jgi:hypothetical protein